MSYRENNMPALYFLTVIVTLSGAKVCLLIQEPDDQGKLRWVLPLENQDLCSCSEIRPGGMNMVIPKRAFQPYYTDHPIFTDDQEIIHDYYKCRGDRYSDCMDFLNGSYSMSGVFKIHPQQYPSGLEVYCDMTSDNGGWIVFQRRYDGSVNFHRNWTEYKQGFGTLTGEFWLGNDILRRLTNGGGGIKWTLRVDLVNEQGSEGFLTRSPFRVIGEEYMLSVGGSESAPHVNNICGQPLGMEDGSIPDKRITASGSYLDKRLNAPGNCLPSKGRLNKPGIERVVGGWCANDQNILSKWFQVDLGERLQVEGVILQGLIDPLKLWPARVTSYQVVYRDVQNSSWLYVVETYSSLPQTFPGNTDQNTPVTSMFDQPIQARYIRIIPKTFSFWISMRMELIGCKGDVLEWANNQVFFTNGRNDDGLGNCANDGGWWFRHGLSCVQSNLNSKYINGSMKWGSLEGSRIVKSEMKIRPNVYL